MVWERTAAFTLLTTGSLKIPISTGGAPFKPAQEGFACTPLAEIAKGAFSSAAEHRITWQVVSENLANPQEAIHGVIRAVPEPTGG